MYPLPCPILSQERSSFGDGASFEPPLFGPEVSKLPGLGEPAYLLADHSQPHHWRIYKRLTNEGGEVGIDGMEGTTDCTVCTVLFMAFSP